MPSDRPPAVPGQASVGDEERTPIWLSQDGSCVPRSRQTRASGCRSSSRFGYHDHPYPAVEFPPATATRAMKTINHYGLVAPDIFYRGSSGGRGHRREPLLNLRSGAGRRARPTCRRHAVLHGTACGSKRHRAGHRRRAQRAMPRHHSGRLCRSEARFGLRGLGILVHQAAEDLVSHRVDPAPDQAATTWTDSLRSQAEALLAADFTRR